MGRKKKEEQESVAEAGTIKQLTPAMRQYFQAKAEHPEALLLFRMGDFYELFGDDARTAAKVLSLTLTTRDREKSADAIPMAGVPHHAIDGYVSRLLASGFKVAICDQMEDPRFAKGIVKREVTRVITPATATDAQSMAAKESNYLAVVATHGEFLGLALLDMLTGHFRVTKSRLLATIFDELGRLLPRELVVPLAQKEALEHFKESYGLNAALTIRADDYFVNYQGGEKLAPMWQERLNTWQQEDPLLAMVTTGTLAYLNETLGSIPMHIELPEVYELLDYMQIDEICRRNLELTRTSYDNVLHGSLLWHLDHAMTPMGSRRIKEWLLYPLTSPRAINERLDVVEAFFDNGDVRHTLADFLKQIADLERLNGKLAARQATPRDLAALAASLAVLEPLVAYLSQEEIAPAIRRIASLIDPLSDIFNLLRRAIREEPMGLVGGGEIFNEGYNKELDECRRLKNHGREVILALADKERKRSGINTLRISYNKVFGYYIEVPRARAAEVPKSYMRRQTTVNGERYITEELKVLEDKVLSAEERLSTLEQELFQQLLQQLLPLTSRIRATATLIGELDGYLALAEVAAEWNYCRPKLTLDNAISITAGRHPVIERLSRQLGERFIANDCHLDDKENQLLIITGPNMAGKSTMMRQVALITLMAHMGSFVPAEKAEIGIRDRIFTRVGASDILHKGQSTFMVEMCETATILKEATPRSLIILDEIGRGTSTYDGLSIAWAIAEQLLDNIGALTLFATHYHELTALSAEKPKAQNYNVLVREVDGEIIFLRRLEAGAASRSYGIEVARLAGLPPTLIARSRELLAHLEEANSTKQREIIANLAEAAAENAPNQLAAAGEQEANKALVMHKASRQLSFFDEAAPSPIAKALKELDIDDLTPRQALEMLYKLKEMAG